MRDLRCVLGEGGDGLCRRVRMSSHVYDFDEEMQITEKDYWF